MRAIRPRIASALACAAACAAPGAHALTLGVTEGVTYRATDAEIAAKFAPIAAHLSAALKQPVDVRVLNTYNALRDATRKGEVDLAFVHPAHVALEASGGGRYAVAAWTKGFTEYRVSFLCKDPAPIADWSALKDRKIVTPDPDSITAVMTRAMLKENGLGSAGPKVLTTRFQDAVPFYVENKFANYGATAAKAVIKDWTDKGGKVCAQSRPVPIKQWIVLKSLPPDAQQTVRDTLVGMAESEAGRKALEPSGYKGFEPVNANTEKSIQAWLGL